VIDDDGALGQWFSRSGRATRRSAFFIIRLARLVTAFALLVLALNLLGFSLCITINYCFTKPIGKK
jgi:hypothetical protein